MKNVILGLAVSAALTVSSAAVAETSYYEGFDFAEKQKLNTAATADVAEKHDVYGAFAGVKSGKLSLEGRMEDEVVHDPAGHQGLFQGKASLDLMSVSGVTPFVAGAVGYKSKQTINFDYYVVEGGLKYNVANLVDLKLASRLRSPFGEKHEHEVGSDLYRTVENSVSASVKLPAKNAVVVKYARERGDSNYNTWLVGVTHSFK